MRRRVGGLLDDAHGKISQSHLHIQDIDGILFQEHLRCSAKIKGYRDILNVLSRVGKIRHDSIIANLVDRSCSSHRPRVERCVQSQGTTTDGDWRSSKAGVATAEDGCTTWDKMARRRMTRILDCHNPSTGQWMRVDAVIGTIHPLVYLTTW